MGGPADFSPDAIARRIQLGEADTRRALAKTVRA
jgi:hypothetical protein